MILWKRRKRTAVLVLLVEIGVDVVVVVFDEVVDASANNHIQSQQQKKEFQKLEK